MALGVLDPVLNDLHQLRQKEQGALIAAHHRFLGQVHRRGVVLAIGQPALQGTHQVDVELAGGVGQLGFMACQAVLQGGGQVRLHFANRPHLEGLATALEAGPQDFIAAGGNKRVEQVRLGADIAVEAE